MFGIGKKDSHGNQVRIEHRGKHTRASRTGGASVRAQGKVGKTTLTANSKHGIRVSRKVAPGTRMAIQRGRFQLLGRWSKGPFNLNMSKSGFSLSAKNKRGSYNISNPNRSSFKIAGTQFRGKKAAQLQTLYLLWCLAVYIVAIAFWLVLFPILLLLDLFSLALRRQKAPQLSIEEDAES